MTIGKVEVVRRRALAPLAIARLKLARAVLAPDGRIDGQPVVDLACRGSITIGEGSPRRRMPTLSKDDEVGIGTDVFIGGRSIILETATIGAGGMVGARSVIAGDAPAGAAFAVRWLGATSAARSGE